MNNKLIIKEILNKNRIYKYHKFEQAIYDFFSNYMYPIKLIFKNSNQYNGYFDIKNNIIFINKKIIKNIFIGNISLIYLIFHEYEHYEILNKIKNNEINKYLFNVIVEEEFINFENKNNKNNFYKENYNICAIENYADFLAIKKTFKFFKDFNIKLNEDELNVLKRIYLNSEFNLNIESRLFYTCDLVDNYCMTIDEIYDFLIEKGIDLKSKYPKIKPKQIIKK